MYISKILTILFTKEIILTIMTSLILLKTKRSWQRKLQQEHIHGILYDYLMSDQYRNLLSWLESNGFGRLHRCNENSIFHGKFSFNISQCIKESLISICLNFLRSSSFAQYSHQLHSRRDGIRLPSPMRS